MPRLYAFADEAGDFNFSNNPRASRYFIVCTMTCHSCSALGGALLDLRREMIWNGNPVGEYFHATEDKQVVRDKVYALLQTQDFQIQATIMEKAKAQPQVRPTNHRFYKYGWYYHLKFAAPKFLGGATEVLMTTASVGTQKGQAAFSSAVNDVAQQVIRGGRKWRTNFCRSIADPCLQAADYCTWAMQKKWEKGDTRPYDLIKDRVIHEADMWERGTRKYY